MKKKILFIIGTLQSGGVSKSMVSLLNAFDRTQYRVSLFVTSTEGNVFGQYLPKDIEIITNSDVEDLLGGFAGVKSLLFRGKLWLAMASMLRILLSFVSKPMMGEWLAKIMPKVTDEEYDLIVDYGGQHQLYYMMDKLKGNKKVTFFHSDYSKWPYYYKADKKYYSKADAIFSISQVCVDALKRYFPECVDKINVMENISSPAVIQRQAMEEVDVPKAEILLATLGHFCKQKGSSFSIEAGKILKDRGINFKWLFIGKIIDQDLYEEVKRSGLEEYFIFTGIKSNPYPYLKACDIYVHPSRFEGKSIALDEAKILCKPIVVTNFSTVGDQFIDRVNASICEMNGASVAEAILELVRNKALQNSYQSYLKEHIIDNTDEVKKLYNLI